MLIEEKRKSQILKLISSIRNGYNISDIETMEWISKLPVQIKISLLDNNTFKEMSLEKYEAFVFSRKDSGEYLIGINKEKHNTYGKFNFTLMHEIGHILLKHLGEEDILFREIVGSENNDQMEAEANFFASEMLMPTEEIKKMITQDPDNEFLEYEISKKYNVSYTAASYKVKNVKKEMSS